METLIRLSSTLSSQIKELGVKVTARDVRTKGVNGTGRVDPAQSFSACVLNTAVAGEVFFEPSDSLHDFIQQIEDSIIYLLLEKVSLTELPSVSGFFVSQAAKFHDIDLTACIYSNSPLATIRSSIRIIASNDIGRIMEHLESIFVGVSSLIEKKITLLPESFLRGLNFPSSVSELSRKQLFFALQDNDPFAQVLHCRLSPSSLSSPSLSTSSAISKTKSTVLSIRVENAGSEQVHGLYSLSTSLSKVNSHGVTLQNPVYNNSDGYMISCQQKEVCLSVENVSSRCEISKDEDGSTEPMIQSLDSCPHFEPDSIIISYRWVISNPSLDCKYYTCSTMEPSPLPPAVGWKSYENSCQGKLPGPHLVLVMVDDESQDDSDSGKSEIDNDNKQSEITDAANTATISAKETATKLKTKNKSARKKTATSLVSSSFPPCVATMTDSCKDSAENETCSTQPRQISKRSLNHRRKSQRRLFAPQEEVAEAVLMSTCCTGTDKVEVKVEVKVDSICKDQQLSVFSEALEMMKLSHCHRAEESIGTLEMHMKRLNAAEVAHSSKLQEMTERQAWLTAVTDTDELLKGFPCPGKVEIDNDDSHSNSMEAFAAEWDLKSAVSRAKAACLLTNSACLLSKALIDHKVLDAAATTEPIPVTVTVPVQALEQLGAVRKVASLPTFKEEDVKHDRGHRRSLSQSQSQPQSHSIFQWPEGEMPPPSVNFLIENDQYRQLPIRPDGSSPHRSASQLQWSPSVTESTTTSNGAVLSALESSEIPVTIDSLASNKGDSDSRSGEGDGEWDGEGEGSSACFESLLNAISPAEQQCLSYSIIDVIGIQMRVPQNNSNGSVTAAGASLTANGAGAGGLSEKAHYVIRISLRDSGLPRTIKAVQTTVRTHSNSGSISGSRIRIPLSPPSITVDRDSPGGSADGVDCNDGIIVEPSHTTNISKSCHPSLPIVKESIIEQQGQSNLRRHSMAGV